MKKFNKKACEIKKYKVVGDDKFLVILLLGIVYSIILLFVVEFMGFDYYNPIIQSLLILGIILMTIGYFFSKRPWRK